MRTTDLSSRARRRFGAVGATVLAGALAASFLAARDAHPGSTRLQAVFARAGEGLDDRSDVKIRGVRVGQVAGVRLTPDGRARVTLRLDRGVRAPVGAEAAIVPLSVFGPKYVDLRPGAGEASGPYLPDGATIARTADPQEITDVAAPTVALLDALGPQDVATIMRTLGAGLDGRGAELGGLLDDSATLLGLGARRSGDLGTVLGDGAALAATAAAHGGDITRMADDLNTVLPAVTGSPAEFDRLLGGLTGASRTLTGILVTLPDAPGRIIDAIVPAVGVMYRNRSAFPALISSSGSLLTQLTGIATIPGPHGTLLSNVTVHVNPSTVLCDALPGVCGPIEPAIPNDPDAARRAAGKGAN
ncbi:MlaD family protein [Actinomadura parmotrematis]|uniref:MCE family protein n=1 Tax=Actinomadura parmotrematis TaxID=2864039 RepID=A0ABS7G1H9_9ACTN|nr:MCE family protein [Actinomadura parmotrematis]MBW8486356.1 MCE family protein [Actinomadura parmotrematis]